MADTIDFAAVGKALQQQYPQYSNSNPEALGQLYVKKYRPADYEAYSRQQSAQTSLGESVAKKQADRAIDYSPEAIQQEVNKTVAISQATADIKEKQDQIKSNRKAAELKNEIIDKARRMADVIEAGKSGKLTGQAYKIAYKQAASNYAAARGFQEGGKALTGPELTQLAGSMPRIRQQNALDKLLGNPPTGEVVDSQDELYQKALLALQDSKNPNDKKRATDSLNKFNQSMSNPTGLDSIPGNAVTDVKDMLGGILNLGKAQVRGDLPGASGLNPMNPAGVLQQLIQNPQAYKNLINTAIEGSKQSKQQYEGIANNPGEAFQQHPVATTLALLPFLKGAGELGGIKGLSGAGKVSNVAGETEALSKVGILDQAGRKLRADVRNIDVGPQVGGPQREAYLNNVANEIGLKGGPAEQYAQLQPKMKQFGEVIQKKLDKDQKIIKLDDIKNDLMKNLENDILASDLNKVDAQKAVSGYLRDIYGDKIGTKTTTANLFELKQKVNRNYKGIQTKLENGTPLTPREQVVSTIRKTIDDIITENHPDIKDLTTKQSALYDLSESLYKQKNNKMRVKVPFTGNFLPLPSSQIRGVGDTLGRILSTDKPM